MRFIFINVLWSTLTIIDDVMLYFCLIADIVGMAGLTVRRVPFHAPLLGLLGNSVELSWRASVLFSAKQENCLLLSFFISYSDLNKNIK